MLIKELIEEFIKGFVYLCKELLEFIKGFVNL